jgi:hypothetical protein
MMVAVGYGAHRDSVKGLGSGADRSSGLLSDVNGSKVKRFRFATRIPVPQGAGNVLDHGGSRDISSA